MRPFDHIPVFSPPYPPRPEHRVSALRALIMFAKDLLRPFATEAFSNPLTQRRILGRDLLIFNSPETVREALVDRHQALQRKTPQMRAALEPLAGDGLIISDDKVWKERRTIVAPIVHTKHMPTFFPIMLEAAVEWREQWRSHVNQGPIDILNEMAVLTAEIISRSVFGQRIGRRYTDPIVSCFAAYQQNVSQLALADMLRLPSWVPRGQGRKTKAAAQGIQTVIDQILDEHLLERSQNAKRRDAGQECPHQAAMIDRLIDAGEADGGQINREGIRNEAIVLFLAGHETTANTLAWAFYLLSQADWARERMDAELASVLDGRAPVFADVSKLVYTRAVIEETLRLYPPIPILGREAMTDVEVQGSKIKKESIVLVAPWLLHRNPTLWERPDDFIPERFLPEAPRPNKYQYVPFSVGPRVCPGLAFGLTEAVVCLAVLRQAYDLRLAPGTVIEPKTRLTLRPGDTLPMNVIDRDTGAPAA